MEFKSSEPGYLLSLTRNDSGDPRSSYTIRAQISTKCGEFQGENKSIHFSAFPKFLNAFKEFLSTRKGEVKLELTERSELVFFRWNQKGDVGLRFTISRITHQSGPQEESVTSLAGSFPLASEYLNALQSELAQFEDT
jgi:hypothetical protein